MTRKLLAILPLVIVAVWCFAIGLTVWATAPECPAGAVLARPQDRAPVCVRVNPEPVASSN